MPTLCSESSGIKTSTGGDGSSNLRKGKDLAKWGEIGRWFKEKELSKKEMKLKRGITYEEKREKNTLKHQNLVINWHMNKN